MIEKKIETKGHDHVFDSIHAWLGDEQKIYVRVEGMGNIRTVSFDLNEMDQPIIGSPLDPTISKQIKKAEKELKSVEKKLHLHKIILGRELKSLEAKKDKVDRYCRSKKKEAQNLISKSINVHSQKFIKSCSSFSKSLIEFLETRVWNSSAPLE